MKSPVYMRTISSSEAREGHIMILKSDLSFFPLKGSQFELIAGGKPHAATVEAVHCECRGPAEPHDHYFISWPKLNAGDTVIVEKDGRKPGVYRLKVRSGTAQQGPCG